jgi:hypothetical protein
VDRPQKRYASTAGDGFFGTFEDAGDHELKALHDRQRLDRVVGG